MLPPLTTLTGARAFANDIQRALMQQFTETGRLDTVLILFMTRDPQTGLLLPNRPIATRVAAVPVTADPDTGLPVLGADPFESDASKAAFSLIVRQLAAKSDSVGLLLAHEAWLIFATPGASLDPSILPSAHPERQEVVLLTLQHHGGSAVWQAPILRNVPDDGPRALGPFEEIPLHGARGTGQFWNLLPPQSHQNN